MKIMLILCAFLLLLPFACAHGEEHGDLVSCEYSVYGGMENERMSMLLAAGPDWDLELTVRKNDSAASFAVPRTALADLEAYVAALQPDTWADLPEREEFALDAPTRRVTVSYADGSEFTLASDKEDSGTILHGISCFLESYTVQGRDTFSLPVSRADNSDASFRPVISAPEKLAWDIRIPDDAPCDPPAEGTHTVEILEFRGRIPGTVEVYIPAAGPQTPDGEANPTVYLLEIDTDYNVKLIETREAAPAEFHAGTLQPPTEIQAQEDEQMSAFVRATPLLVLEFNGHRLTATPEDNSSAAALVEKLREGPVTLQLHDYGHFEKVGPLPWSLPRNDTSITTVPGDVILYQGNQITIYYDENTWSFTRLARIEGKSRDELLSLLGDGDVTVTCWVEWSE